MLKEFSAVQMVCKVTPLKNGRPAPDVSGDFVMLMMNVQARIRWLTRHFLSMTKYFRSQMQVLKKKAEAFFPTSS